LSGQNPVLTVNTVCEMKEIVWN